MNQENAELLAMVRQMEQDSALQREYAKKQYLMAKITAACSGCILAAVLLCACLVMPRINRTFDEMNVVLENLEEVSGQLTKADLPGMLQNVDELVEGSRDGMTLAMEKISELDIDSMNEAIRDLHAVVQPLARLFGR